jgi:hypothetical protein
MHADSVLHEEPRTGCDYPSLGHASRDPQLRNYPGNDLGVSGQTRQVRLQQIADQNTDA